MVTSLRSPVPLLKIRKNRLGSVVVRRSPRRVRSKTLANLLGADRDDAAGLTGSAAGVMESTGLHTQHSRFAA